MCVRVCVCVCGAWCGGVCPPSDEKTLTLSVRCPPPDYSVAQRYPVGGSKKRGGAGWGGLTDPCNLSCRMRQPKPSHLFIVLIHSSLHRSPPRTHPSQPQDRHRGLVSNLTHTRMYTHTHTHMRTRMYAHTHMRTRIHTERGEGGRLTCAHTHTHTRTHVHTHTHTQTHTHTRTHTHTCTYTHTHAHTIPSSGPHLRKKSELLSTSVTAATSQRMRQTRSPNLAMTDHAYFMCKY